MLNFVPFFSVSAVYVCLHSSGCVKSFSSLCIPGLVGHLNNYGIHDQGHKFGYHIVNIQFIELRKKQRDVLDKDNQQPFIFPFCFEKGSNNVQIPTKLYLPLSLASNEGKKKSSRKFVGRKNRNLDTVSYEPDT